MVFLSSTFKPCIRVMHFSGFAPVFNEEEGENIEYKMFDLKNTAIFILILAHDLSPKPFYL